MREAKGLLWFLAAIALAVTAPVFAQAPSVPPGQARPIFGFPLPAQIDGARREKITDFEKTQVGLGYGVRYRLPDWTIDIYVYDLKLVSIPDDPMSEIVRTEHAAARNDVFSLAQRNMYRDVAVKQEYVIADSAGRPRFVCSALALFHVARNVAYDTYLCLGGWHGKFVKFRMSTPRSETSSATSRRFITAWLGVLWPQS